MKKKQNRVAVLYGTIMTGIGTLFSRILGMLRDSATAAVLGMSAGGVMDSFVIAFRLPDVARRMFGEGSLSVGFIPVFAKLWNEDKEKAWKLLTVALGRMFAFLAVVVIIGEIACFAGFTLFPPESKIHFVSRLASLLLPYLILICMAALSAAALQTLGSFGIASCVPMILNVIWLFGLLVVAPMISQDPKIRCYILTICILIAGLIQFSILIPYLRRFGARFDYDFNAVCQETEQITATFFPQMIGLMSIQINVLVATVFAWLFSGDTNERIRWLGGIAYFPMERGAASALYFSERLYEFPQGMLGLAVATAIFPLFSKNVANLNFTALAEDISFGIRFVLTLAIPAGVGLAMLSENLAHLLYQRHSFTETDTFRTADLIFWFSIGIWAFCAIPILVRGFYVMQDQKTPLRIGVSCCSLHVLLCGILIWTMQEQGLALSASIAAGLQAVWLLLAFSAKHHQIGITKIVIAVLRSLFASFLMAIVIHWILEAIPGNDSSADIAHIFFSAVIGGAVFAVTLWLLGGKEILAGIKGREKHLHQ